MENEPKKFVQIAPKLYVPESWTEAQKAAFLAGYNKTK